MIEILSPYLRVTTNFLLREKYKISLSLKKLIRLLFCCRKYLYEIFIVIKKKIRHASKEKKRKLMNQTGYF